MVVRPLSSGVQVRTGYQRASPDAVQEHLTKDRLSQLKFIRKETIMATEACCTPAPPAVDTSQGREETLAGLHVYLSGSPSASAAVILIADVFVKNWSDHIDPTRLLEGVQRLKGSRSLRGEATTYFTRAGQSSLLGYEAPLLRKLADKVAAAGYLVVVPDYFRGDSFKQSEGEHPWAGFTEWLTKHPPKEKVGITRKLVEVIKDKGISSVGIAGFCYSAKVAVCSAKEGDVRAVVQFHPSLIEPSDYEEVAVPISILAAPTDGVEKYEDLLASRTELKSFLKVFPDVRHGWAVRYDEKDENAVERANEAHKLMLDWFAKYL